MCRGFFWPHKGEKDLDTTIFREVRLTYFFSLIYFEYRNEKMSFYKCCSKMTLKSFRAFFGLIKDKKDGIQHFLEKSD